MRRKSSDRSVWLIAFAFFIATNYLQSQDPVFTAIVSSTRVRENALFDIRFELQNANGNNFQPPEFREFRIAGGPSIGTSTTIINSKVSRSESWTYTLIAPAEGTYTIGSASVIAGRRKLSTQPISITVVKSDVASAGGTRAGTGSVILAASIPAGDFYPGQQIPLEYKLLYTENIQSANTVAEDDYSGFFVQNFNAAVRQSTYETLNGITYVSKVVKAVALFAHQSGSYEIDPMVLMLGIQAPYPSNQGFFAFNRLHNIQVASDPLSINILPLPPDEKDQNFSGAVGEYTITTLPVNDTQLTTDDDLSIRVEIRGNGDARRWDPPEIQIDGKFDVYSPKIIEDKHYEANGSLQHSRLIEYVLIPLEPGVHTVSIPFRYFDPEEKSYKTIYSDTIDAHITQGSLASRKVNRDSITVTPGPLKKINFTTTDDRFWRSIPHLLLFGLLSLGAIVGIWVNHKKRLEETIPEDERVRSASGRHARHQLELLISAKSITDQESKERLTEIYYKFLEERFSIPPADLDAEKLRRYLMESSVTESTIDQAVSFFNTCLSLRYGAVTSDSNSNDLITRCKMIIEHLDAEAAIHI